MVTMQQKLLLLSLASRGKSMETNVTSMTLYVQRENIMADFGYFLNSNVSSQTQRRTDIFFSSLGK
jgi:hypothetical protein